MPFIGSPCMSPSDIFGADPASLDSRLFFRFRLPRTLTAFAAGAALALGGCVFQAVFRNALASPFTLGISGGASFGAALATQFGLGVAAFGSAAIQGSAFAGAMLSVLLVCGMSKLRRTDSASALLLSGIASGFLFSSLIMLFQYIGNPDSTLALLHWMMGGIAVSGMRDFITMLIPVCIGAAAVFVKIRELDMLLLGRELAASRGLNVRATRMILFSGVSLMVGTVVAVCGPVGFVGLMVPHICRAVTGAKHGFLIPSSALAGGILLVVCDAVSRTVISPAELPLGIITALIGTPFFISLVRSSRI